LKAVQHISNPNFHLQVLQPPTFSRVQDLAAVFLNLQTDGQKGVSPQQPRE
jgi:hypothetical protein